MIDANRRGKTGQITKEFFDMFCLFICWEQCGWVIGSGAGRQGLKNIYTLKTTFLFSWVNYHNQIYIASTPWNPAFTANWWMMHVSMIHAEVTIFLFLVKSNSRSSIMEFTDEWFKHCSRIQLSTLHISTPASMMNEKNHSTKTIVVL